MLSLEFKKTFFPLSLQPESLKEQGKYIAQGRGRDMLGDYDIDYSTAVCHSAGCLTGIEWALNMPAGTVKHLILIAPPPLLGSILPSYLSLEMLRKPEYRFKCLPWASHFKLLIEDNLRLMFGPDVAKEIALQFCEEWSGTWYPEVIAQNAFSFLNPCNWFRNLKDQFTVRGIKITVIYSDGDNMIRAETSEKVANQLGATHLKLEGISHLGYFLGRHSESFLKTLQGFIGEASAAIPRFNESTKVGGTSSNGLSQLIPVNHLP